MGANAISDKTMSINDKQANKTKNITVLYFADLADEANCHEEKVSVSQSTSLTELYEQLSARHQFSRPQSELRVAVNDYFVKWSESIHDGDHVVFIVPVAGG